MKIEVSIGEVVDKATILEIKTEKFQDPEKLENVKNEYNILKKALKEQGITPDSDEYKRLKKINLKLWDIEDNIRKEEAAQNFSDKFIQLARDVYLTNDKRAAIKKEINLKYNSDIIEEKEYVEYKNK